MLPRKYKLKKDNDFKKIFRQGKNYQQEFIKIKIFKNNLAYSRFGFIIGLKISKKSTQRNRIRRRLEEIVRSNLTRIKPGYDIVILAKPAIIEKNYQEIAEALIGLLEKTKLFSLSSKTYH